MIRKKINSLKELEILLDTIWVDYDYLLYAFMDNLQKEGYNSYLWETIKVWKEISLLEIVKFLKGAVVDINWEMQLALADLWYDNIIKFLESKIKKNEQ